MHRYSQNSTEVYFCLKTLSRLWVWCQLQDQSLFSSIHTVKERNTCFQQVYTPTQIYKWMNGCNSNVLSTVNLWLFCISFEMLTLWLSKARTCECLLWKWLFPRSSSHSFPQKYLGSLAASGIYSCRLHLMAISCCKYTEFLTGFESVSHVGVTFLGHRPLEMLFNWEGGNLIRGLMYLGHGLAFSPLYLMFLNVPKGWREQEECLSGGVCGLCA